MNSNMSILKYCTFAGLFCILACQTAFKVQNGGDTPVYLDPKAPVDKRVKDLMARMTFEEKVAQMCQYVGLDHMRVAEKKLSVEEMKKSDAQGFYVGLFSDDVAKMVTEGKIGSFLHVVTPEEANLLQGLAQKSRLKIPLLIGIDAIHGNGLVSGATIYPTPITMAATWDDQLTYVASRQTALEMRATGSHWAFTPNIDVLREPRWGRSGETFGEDPFMVGNLGVQTILGFQTNDFTGTDKVIACAKHLIAGSQSLNGLNSSPTDISERTLQEVFLPPYKRAIREANVFSVMTAHNELNGIPCHMDKRLMTDVLRTQYGFEGFYVSDWNDVERIHSYHKTAVDFKEAVQFSVGAGLDMHMHGPKFQDYVVELVKEGKLATERVDVACTAILEAKFRLGLFENAVVDISKVKETVFKPEHQATALESARKAITLLENKGILPLSGAGKKILVSGCNANNQTTLGDWASPQPEDQVVTVWEGIEALAKKKGWTTQLQELPTRSKEMTAEQIKTVAAQAANVDVVVLVLGENSFRHDWPNKTTGENIDRSTLQLSGTQLKLAEAVKAAGKPFVVIYVSGSPISEPWISENANAVICAWEPGNFGGQAVAEVLFGDLNPSGKLPVTIPRSVGQLQMYYNHKPSMYIHKYHNEKKIPLYAFGYGQSFTTYKYSAPVASGTMSDTTGKVTVTLNVTNAGTMAGEEVVQLYIRDQFSSATRPVKELKGYQRVALAPGETKAVQFELAASAFAFFDLNMQYCIEPGTFTIMTGPSSMDKDLQKTTFQVKQRIALRD
jgi:beta-glucosidase